MAEIQIGDGGIVSVAIVSSSGGKAVLLTVQRDGDRIGDLIVPLESRALSRGGYLAVDAEEALLELALLTAAIGDCHRDQPEHRDRAVSLAKAVDGRCYLSEHRSISERLVRLVERGDWAGAHNDIDRLKRVFTPGI